MSGTVFPIELGARRWDLPRLPFGVARRVAPGLMRQAGKLAAGDALAIARRLDESALAKLVELVALALRTVDPAATVETLDTLFFGPAELRVAAVQVLQACGLPIGEGRDAPSAASRKRGRPSAPDEDGLGTSRAAETPIGCGGR